MNAKTVPLDVPTGFLFGALIPLFAMHRIRASQPAPAGGVVPIATGLVAFYGLSVMPAYWAFPDWMWGYMMDIQKIPAIYGLVFFLAVAGAGAVGAIVSQSFIARGQTSMAVATALFGFLAYLSVMLLMTDQYLHVGTFASYHAGQATPLSKDAGIQALSTKIALANIVVLVGTLIYLFRSDRTWKTKTP